MHMTALHEDAPPHRLMLTSHCSASSVGAAPGEQLPVSFQEERERLINDTRDYALTLACRGVVVFDAQGNRDPGAATRCVHW